MALDFSEFPDNISQNEIKKWFKYIFENINNINCCWIRSCNIEYCVQDLYPWAIVQLAKPNGILIYLNLIKIYNIWKTIVFKYRKTFRLYLDFHYVSSIKQFSMV